ncbi:hypothetical protein C2S53_011354 [Perilla frutescens var. hirtella]|uniref:DUF7792 domain-containing protein n=1 Tax=Perilla frutescens var. hirtella TaxID=608512 RepID=A0AAD4J8P9_PERFH|nr:hypothetical protein C2S53_011354 [Perilla frutescens var. hirtella]
MAWEEEKSIQEILSLQILFADRVIKLTQEAESFKPENSDLSGQVTQLFQLLRSAARLTITSAAVYDRPIRRVAVDLTMALDRVFILAHKCRHWKTNVLHHVLSITTAADFKKVSALLDSSLADFKWVLSILNPDSSGYETALPPIATTDPILAWVWPAVAAAHMGRAEAALELASWASGNDRNKKIIAEENGIPPLLKMLKDSSNVDGQSAAATALCNLADDQGRVKIIADISGVQIIAKALSEAPAPVQVILVNLVSKMSELDTSVQEEFGRENVTRPLVTLLSMDVELEEFVEANARKSANTLHSLAQINKEMTKKRSGGSSEGRREAEAKPPEVNSRLKISCAAALWILARRSLLNSGKITDTKALRVLAKIIEKEQGELKENCLKVVMELAAVAESHADLKRSAFKLTSTPVKVVLDQLLRVINEEKNSQLVILAVKAVGCLASMFPAKERRVVRSLVAQLSHLDHDVAAEAARALSKFACVQNYNCKEHSKAIIEFGGVPKLMILLRNNVRGYFHLEELVLLCNLAVNGHNTGALEEAGVLSLLESAATQAVFDHPDLRELFAKAIHQLVVYQIAIDPHLYSSMA